MTPGPSRAPSTMPAMSCQPSKSLLCVFWFADIVILWLNTATGDVHSMDATAIEVPHALTHTWPAEEERHDHNYSCRQSTCIKLDLTVNTANNKKLTWAASALRRDHCRSVVHIHTCSEGLEVPKEEEKFTPCRERDLLCAVKPGWGAQHVLL